MHSFNLTWLSSIPLFYIPPSSLHPCIHISHSHVLTFSRPRVLTFSRPSDNKDHRAKHGLYRALVNNMIVGVTEGYAISLELVGVGFRASCSGQDLTLALGYSHPIVMRLPKEIKLDADTKKGANPYVKLSSHDKQLIGTVAAKIRSLRKPEPYKGKGIRYTGEQVRRKAGKTAAK